MSLKNVLRDKISTPSEVGDVAPWVWDEHRRPVVSRVPGTTSPWDCLENQPRNRGRREMLSD